jgi:hypothetical protein
MQVAITEMVHQCKVAVRRLPEKLQNSQNCEHFLKTPLARWLLSSAELCVSKATDPSGGCDHWVEPKHWDGGASILHMGLTLYGKRDLVCEQGQSDDGAL